MVTIDALFKEVISLSREKKSPKINSKPSVQIFFWAMQRVLCSVRKEYELLLAIYIINDSHFNKITMIKDSGCY